jgi:hypothetical protein
MLISHTTQIVARDQIHNEKTFQVRFHSPLKWKKKGKNTDLVLTSVKVYI